MIIYLVRHGDPDYANDTITPKGHKEAEAVSKRLASVGLDKIYSSPLGRAIATMKYTADLLKMPYGIEEWTKEISDFSVSNEKLGQIAAWKIPGEEIFSGKQYPSIDSWHEAPFLSELPAKSVYDEIVEGSNEFLARHGYTMEGRLYRAIMPNNEKIALFAHGGFGVTWLAHLLNIPVPVMWCGFHLFTTSVTTIFFEPRPGGLISPRCLGVGDLSHLDYGSHPTVYK